MLGRFVATFVAVFLAELPDKTMVATLVLTTTYRRAFWVWLGAAAAFLVHVTVAVIAGDLLARLPDRPVKLVVAVLFRISSLSALVAIALSPALFLLFHRHGYAALALLLSALIYYMHRDNIRRLIRGEEPRIGAKSGVSGATQR